MELKKLKEKVKSTFYKYFDKNDHKLVCINERKIYLGDYHIEYVGVDKIGGVFVNFTINDSYGVFNANSTDGLLANPTTCRYWLKFIEELREVLKEKK